MMIIIVDLTGGEISERPLDDPLAGGRLLTGQLVTEFVDPKTDPLGPGNALIFASGPLAAKRPSTGSRLSVGGKSPLTNGIKEANSGGMGGDSLASQGCRALVVRGMRPEGKSDHDIGHFITSKCGAALTELTIDHEGYILPCPFLPKTNENIFQKSLKDIWYHSNELAAYQVRDNLEGGCGTCSRKLSCSGCRARALGHTGSINGPDIRCPVCQ